MGSPASASFVSDAQVLKVDVDLGLVFGFAIVCKVDGEDYEDLQGDTIPEDSMLEAAADFMQHSRVSKEMHSGDQDGTVVFAFPLTTDIAKALGIQTEKTGLIVALKPSPDVLEKFRDGTYTGFSIGGQRLLDEPVGKYDDSQERDDHGRFGSGGGTAHVEPHEAVRESAVAVHREGDAFHFTDEQGNRVATAGSHAEARDMARSAGLGGISQEMRDLKSGEKYHFKRAPQVREPAGRYLGGSLGKMSDEHDSNLRRLHEIASDPRSARMLVKEHARLLGRNAELRHLMDHAISEGHLPMSSATATSSTPYAHIGY